MASLLGGLWLIGVLLLTSSLMCVLSAGIVSPVTRGSSWQAALVLVLAWVAAASYFGTRRFFLEVRRGYDPMVEALRAVREKQGRTGPVGEEAADEAAEPTETPGPEAE